MVKARAIVPLTHPETGEPIAAGAEVELGDDHYRDLRARGAVEASEEEQKESQQQPGVYDARTGREEAGGLTGEQEPPAEEPPKTEKKK